ncbi:MAG: DUF502 domain-containing protein [Steroidobacteraceae bacterium]
MFRSLRRALLRGFVVVLPLSLTVWLLWWLGSSTESLLRETMLLAIPAEHYRPGMGVLAAVLLLIAIGLVFNTGRVRRALEASEEYVDRVPVVKTIYGATRDFLKLVPVGGRRRELKRVVMARFGEAQIIGFVTRDDASELGIVDASDDLIAVYFPMSYQIGGYTMLLPRTSVVTLDLPVETAMRLVLTGGVSGAAI